MQELKSYQEALFDCNRSNPLLNLKEKQRCKVDIEEGSINFEFDAPAKKILAKSVAHKKSFGLDTLMVSKEILRWNYKGYEVCSPIFLFPAEAKKVSGSKKPLIHIDEQAIVNPVLNFILNQEFHFDLNNDSIDEFIAKNDFSRENGNYLANFNYKKYLLVQDFESINETNLSPVLQRLFFGDKNEVVLSNSTQAIYPTDLSQNEVLQSIASGKSIVIQGPPGTGKSRTIANTLAQNLIQQSSQIFVSEKYNALKVVQDLFADAGLKNQISILHDSEKDKKRFVSELKSSWDAFLSYTPKELIPPSNSGRLEKSFRILNQNIEQSNIKYQDLIEWIDWKDLPKTNANPNISLVENWIENEAFIEESFGRLRNLGFDYFSSTILKQLNPSFFKKSLIDFHFENELLLCKDNIASVLSDGIDAGNSLLNLTQASSFARLLASQKDIFLSNLNKESYRNKFRKLREKRAKLIHKRETLDGMMNQWKSIWNKQKLEFIADKIANSKISADHLTKLEQDFSNNFGYEPEFIIKKTLDFYTIQEKIDEIETDLLVHYGIENSDVQISLVNLIFLEFEKLDDSLLELFKNKKGKLLVQKLDASHSKINQINRFSTSVLNFNSNESLESISKQFSSLKNDSYSNEIIALGKDLSEKLSIELFQVICKSESNQESLFQNIAVSSLKFYGKKNFDYRELDSKKLNQIIDLELNNEKETCLYHQKLILEQFHQKFIRYNQLLETPAKQLNEEDKTLKKHLRKGKSILTKEFSKSRNHLSIRHLLASEARPWIDILRPILLLSPLSISEIFDINKQFDWAIFDEASQLKIEDAIPTLQRSKRVVIAGDSQQMGTAHFFQSNHSEQTSLLDFCKYEFEQHRLNFHYRSKHKALFEFCNAHFYENSIQMTSDAKNEVQPIRYFEELNEGYEQGFNRSEAEKIIEFLQTDYHFLKKHSVGIIAFSEKQVQEIKNQIAGVPLISNLFEKEKNFIKSVENIQGDEVDIVILSLTKSANKKGEFSLNFGPINQSGGEKRLNVLFSRARLQMNVFSSFEHQLLSKSDTIGIKVLSEFMKFCKDSIHIKNSETDKIINISDPQISYSSAKKLLSEIKFHQYFNQKFVLSLMKDKLSGTFFD